MARYVTVYSYAVNSNVTPFSRSSGMIFQTHFKVKHGTISTEKLEFTVLCADKSGKGENYASQ